MSDTDVSAPSRASGTPSCSGLRDCKRRRGAREARRSRASWRTGVRPHHDANIAVFYVFWTVCALNALDEATGPYGGGKSSKLRPFWARAREDEHARARRARAPGELRVTAEVIGA